MEKTIKSNRGTSIIVRAGGRKMGREYHMGEVLVSSPRIEVETTSFTSGNLLLNALREDGGQGFLSSSWEGGIKVWTVTQLKPGLKKTLANLSTFKES